MSESISSAERQENIVTLLTRQGRLSVADIVEQFEVSEATARRDLETLADQGKLQRVHGGAICLKQAPPESPILQREAEQSYVKQRIGQAGAALIRDGETIFLGSGTTVLEVARNLRSRRGLTVITNSLPVMNALAGMPDITVVALGGMLRPSELSFIGHITEQALAEVRADKVIIGVHAISLEHGLTNDYLPETMTDRAILKAGREVVVVADHTKANTVATAFLAPLTSIHTFVTDTNAPVDFLDSLRQAGIKVVEA
ncbi:MAG TPA: DeoR/GlpR family DNA-binding transcription regulator [Anaerolineaceae bacterium]|nr:DeoR/GlpR family DNA-binding transcription regulator [Anaerolineaceae bacterium]HPN51973.1 DeoR/GlpR family DNA-binding transcription regulator [Anaerolineaceae bacterium]